MSPRDPNRRLADAVRLLIERTTLAQAPPAALERVARHVEAATDELEPFTGPALPSSSLREMLAAREEGFSELPAKGFRAFYAKSCILGERNAISAPVEVEFDGDTVVAAPPSASCIRDRPGACTAASWRRCSTRFWAW